jgi:hypothetical protein
VTPRPIPATSSFLRASVLQNVQPTLQICSFSNCEEAQIFSLEILIYFMPICVTFAFAELMGLEVRKIIEPRGRSIGACTLRVKMNLESIV